MATPTATATVTPTTTSTPAPYNGPFRQGNGADLRARHAPTPPRIDGDLGEWGENAGQEFNYILLGAEAYGGLPDIGGTFYAQWDADFLYLAARVSDDILVQIQRGDRMDQGDSLAVWLDINLAEDFDNQTANEDDFQIGLSPGDFATIPSEAVIWKPPLPPERAQSIVVASRRTGDGYTVEASIPWSLLGRPPTTEGAFGFAALLIDNDQPATSGQDTVLSGAPNFRPGVPTSWSNLILD
jgi:hypothetical protein